MSDFAKNLRYYRKQKRLSQAELAKALNYGDTTISNYESGRNEPSFDDLINLSHKLSVTPNDLIGFSFMDKDISFIFRFIQLETKHKKIFLWSEVLALSLSKSTAFPAIIQFSDDISNPPTEAPVEL